MEKTHISLAIDNWGEIEMYAPFLSGQPNYARFTFKGKGNYGKGKKIEPIGGNLFPYKM